MIYGLDSSSPSSNPAGLIQSGWQFVCGYLGPVGGTPYIWTPNDWRRQRDAGLDLLPIWVAPYGTPSEQSGVDQGNAALSAMQRIGLSGMVCIDVENGASDPDFVRGFVDACHAGQCAVTVYGSETSLTDAPNVDLWWLANWVQSGIGLHRAPLDFSMWQYATGPQFDYNVAVDSFTFAKLA